MPSRLLTDPVRLLGADDDSASPTDAPPEASGPSGAPDEWGNAETWLVRILLALAFGLAFGIEGMTLVRSFLVDDEPEAEQTTAEAQPTLAEGGMLVPSTTPTVRVRQMRLVGTQDEWIFRLNVRPDTVLAHPYTLSFDRFTTRGGRAFTTAPSHTWAPSDTASFTASWALPVGQRPESLTVTATARIGPDSTTAITRTVSFGHIPVRQQ